MRATSIRVLIARGDVFAAGQRARELLIRADASGHPLVRVIALSAHMRVLLEAGDLVLAEQCLSDVRTAARVARTPLRLARARLLWVDALRTGRPDARGRTRASRLASSARRNATAAARGHRGEAARRSAAASIGSGSLVGAPSAAATMVVMARDEEHDRDAVRKVLAFAAESLQTSRIDLCSADAGPDIDRPECRVWAGHGTRVTRSRCWHRDRYLHRRGGRRIGRAGACRVLAWLLRSSRGGRSIGCRRRRRERCWN